MRAPPCVASIELNGYLRQQDEQEAQEQWVINRAQEISEEIEREATKRYGEADIGYGAYHIGLIYAEKEAKEIQKSRRLPRR